MFLSVILGALVMITLTLIYGVKEHTLRSTADGIINLAGDSLMSEYNGYIQEEYGLFILKGSDAQLSSKLRNYVMYSQESFEDATVGYMKASGNRFMLNNTELIEDQILEHMKFAKAQGILDKLKGSGGDALNDMTERTLKHGPTMVSLPSADMPKANLTALAESIADKASDIEAAFKEGSEGYLINQYVFSYFNTRTNKVSGEHFFKNEAEYILGGEMSDRKNEKRVEMALKAMRFTLNLAHIYADPEKKLAVLTAAEALTPGAAAIATQMVIATTWAYAEADNDIELLWQGYEVPVIKDKASWAVDLDSAIEGIMGETIVPQRTKGYDYEDYLNILLFFQDSGIKTARILDLIQINTRAAYDKDFLIKEHCVGIDIRAEINNRDYSYEKKY